MAHRTARRFTMTLLFLMVGLLMSSPAGAEDLQPMQSAVYGSVVLRFEGFSIVGELDGEMTLSGVLPIDGVATPFEASGTARGIARQVPALDEGLGWGVFTATGVLENGAPIEFRGGVIMRGEGITLIDGLTAYGSGNFLLVILVENARIETTGEIRGSGTGRLVPAEEPVTIAFAASGQTVFEPHWEVRGADRSNPGDGPSLASLLWDLELWPEELLHDFLRLFDTTP